MNRQSISSREHAPPRDFAAGDEGEEARRAQLVEVTIDSLAEVGYVGTTLARNRAPRRRLRRGWWRTTSATRTALLEATFRTLAAPARGAGARAAARSRTPRAAACRPSSTPTSRPRSSTSAPAPRGWRSGDRCCTSTGLKRVQTAYQKRMLSNLRSDLRQMMPGAEARSLAAMIAAMIDGVWLRAALSEWQEADSESARALLTAFVDGRAEGPDQSPPPVRRPRAAAAVSSFRVINPATGATLAEIAVDGRDAGRCRRRARPGRAAQLGRADRRGARAHPAAAPPTLLRERNDELAHLETLNTGKPIQETRAVDVRLGRRVPRVLRRDRRGPRRRAPGSRAHGLRLHAPRTARASSPASAPGTIRCRSPAGSPRRRSPAAMP